MKDKIPSLHPSDGHLRAFRFAADAHQDRMISDGSTSPIQHASQVAIEILLSLAANSEGLDLEFAVQCALLQNVLDATSIKPDRLRIAFGRNVAEAVLALCLDMSLPDEPPVHLRWIDYLRRVRRQPREIWVVVMADHIVKLHSPLRHLDESYANRRVENSMTIYASLREAHQGLASRLMTKIQDYMQYTHQTRGTK